MRGRSLLLTTFLSLPALAGSYTLNGLWESNDVSVCFADAEAEPRDFDGTKLPVVKWEQKRKAKLRRWVERDFTPARTGIHFTGFEDCGAENKAQVVLFQVRSGRSGFFTASGTHGMALLGNQLNNGELMGFPHAKSFATFNLKSFHKGIILHEFGHVARLEHEHDRHEARNDMGCERFIDSVGVLSLDTQTHGPYDAYSLMNYCHLYGRSGALGGLSRGDVSVLRFLYP